MVSKASEDLPEPDRPVITVSDSRGMSTSIPLRLCSRAPRTLMWVSIRQAYASQCGSASDQLRSIYVLVSASHCDRSTRSAEDGCAEADFKPADIPRPPRNARRGARGGFRRG